MTELKITEDTELQTANHITVKFADIADRILETIKIDPENEYRLSIGTDSMTYQDTWFVLAIVLHRVGKGGIYFYKRMKHPAVTNLRTKLYTETEISIDATEILLNKLLERDEDICDKVKLSIHLDIGENGPTKALIQELEGWVIAMGYDYAIKPNSYAASTIANIHSK